MLSEKCDVFRFFNKLKIKDKIKTPKTKGKLFLIPLDNTLNKY